MGKVDQARRHAPGWVQIYVGRTEKWRDLYGEEGRYADNPWRLGSNTSVEARQEVCDLCDDLTEDPEGARTPEPRQPGVWLDRHRVERQRRAGCIQGLVDRVAKGEDILLLCHCRPFGAAREPHNRCHGDGIARTVRLSARAQRQRTEADAATLAPVSADRAAEPTPPAHQPAPLPLLQVQGLPLPRPEPERGPGRPPSAGGAAGSRRKRDEEGANSHVRRGRAFLNSR